MTMKAAILAGIATIFTLTVPAAAQDADTVVATVNGTDITVGHMIVLRNQLPPQYQQLEDEVLFNGILEQLIQQTVLMQMQGDDLSRADRLSLENDRRAYLAGVALNAAADAAVSDAALQALYDESFADFTPVTEYNASHILVATQEEAAAIKAEIDGGADFAEKAREHSTDGAAQAGGALGWFSAGMMVPQFEAAVVEMKAGEVAGPVQTQFGWHLVRLNDTRDSERPSLDEVREDLAGALRQSAVEELITGLVDDADIVRNDEAIDRSTLSDQTLLDQ